MEIDVIRQLEELVRAFGVKLMRMDNRMTEETALMEFDQGLRRFLGYPYEIERGFQYPSGCKNRDSAGNDAQASGYQRSIAAMAGRSLSR